MADDDKKKPEPENPKGRDKAAESRVNKQLAQSENVSKRQEKKQDILAKKAEVLNKITQAAASNSDAKDKNNREIFQNISDITIVLLQTDGAQIQYVRFQFPIGLPLF